jgi:predicted ArsR family transcriptional regulator
MQCTRQQILDYLLRHPGSTAADLSRFLEMTPANIRYHLQLLVGESLVQISGKRKVEGAGRPLLIYNLTSQNLGESLLPLLRAMLETTDGAENLHQVGLRLGSGYSDPGGSPIMRYNAAVAYLNSLNYHASWQADAAGPQVTLRHCPYRDLALTNPLICQVDRELLNHLFNMPLELTRRRDFGNNPYSPCIFSPSNLKGE